MSKLLLKSLSKLKFALAVFAVSYLASTSIAQPSSIDRKKNPYKWMLGVSWNVVDDDGDIFGNMINFQDSWNYLPYPTQLSFDKYLRRGWSLEGMAAYNKYTTPKLISDTTGLSGIFISGDFHVKFSFYRQMGSKWFDPYISAGLGVTYREVRDLAITPTANVALGANFWITKRWGLQLQTVGKFGLISETYDSDSYFFQHSAGIVYRRTDSRKPKRNNKKRFGWTDDKVRFKRKNT